MADLALKIKIKTEADTSRVIGAATADIERMAAASESANKKISGGVKSISEQLAGFRSLYLGLQYAMPAVMSGAKAMLGMAESYKQVNARLTNATQGTVDYANAQAKVVEIAKATGQSLEGIAGLYGKLRTNAGMAAADAERLTAVLAKAIELDGGGAGAQAALFQLQQGLASGTLRGEELNSVMEQTPTLALAIARGLDMPIGKLREYAAEGKLSAEEVKKALFASQADIEKQFDNLPITAARAFENVKTAAILELGALDETLGLSGMFAGAVQAASENMRAVVAVTGAALVSVAALYAQHYASRAAMEKAAHLNTLRMIAERSAAEVAAARASMAGLSGEAMVRARQNVAALAVQSVAAKSALEGAAKGTSLFSGALSGLSGVFRLLTGPIGLAVTGIGALGAALYANRDAVIDLGSTHATVGESLKAGWQIALNGVVRMFKAAGDAIGLSNVRWGDLFAVVFNRTVEFARNAVNGIVGLFVGLGDALGNTAGFIVTRFRNAFSELSRLSGAVFADIKAALSGDFSFSNFRDAFRKGMDSARSDWGQYIDSLKGSMDRALGTDYVGKAFGKIKSAIAVQVEANRQLAADKQAEAWFNETAKAAAGLDTAVGNAAKTGKVAQAAVNAAAKAEKDRLLEWERLQDAFEKARAGSAKAAQQEAKSITEQVKRMREQTEEYGLSAAALHDLEQSRLDAAIAATEQIEAELALSDASNDEVAAIWDKIDALKDLKVARENAYNKKTIVDAERAAADSAARGAAQDAAEWQRASEDIERSLTDALMRGFESGKGFAENLKDTIKNLFNSLILRPIIQPIAQYGSNMVMGMIGMGASGSAMAGGMGGAGNIFSLGSSLTGAMAPGAISTGAGVVVGGIAESFGASSAFAGTLGAGVATALPWIGAIAALGSMFGLFGGKPSNKSAWGTVDLASGEISGLGNMTGKKQASQETLSARDMMLVAVGGFGQSLRALGATNLPETSYVGVGERDGIRLGDKGYGFDPNAALVGYFRDLSAEADGLGTSLKALLVNFNGTAEEFGSLTAALISLKDYAAADPLTAAAEAAEAAGRSAWQVWRGQGADLRAALAAWDGSATAAADLAALTQARYQTEYALAQQINAALASTSAMFATTAEEMRYSTLDQAGKYDYLRDKSVALEEAMASALDPMMIEDLAKQLNENAKTAWQLLGEEEKKIKIDEYESYLAEIDALTTERLNAAGGAIRDERNESLPTNIQAAIEAAMARVAEQFMAAAQAQQAAADTPLVVDFTANVPGLAEVSGG